MHLRILDEIGDKLQAKAVGMGFTAKGRPSPTALLKAIALGEISLSPTEELQVLAQELIKDNRYKLAEQLAQIAGFELKEAQIIKEIKEKIQQQQPFRLSYLDAAGKAFVFDCSYAQISSYENKQYLEVSFVNEVGGNVELGRGNNLESNSRLQAPAHSASACSTPIRKIDSNSPEPLKTNRCLKLHRVPEDSRLEDLPKLTWGDLSYLEISFELYGNLAYSYSQEEGDRTEPIKDGILVTRKVSNDFFFLRQILRYGDRCKIVAPDFIVSQAETLLENTLELYELG